MLRALCSMHVGWHLTCRGRTLRPDVTGTLRSANSTHVLIRLRYPLSKHLLSARPRPLRVLEGTAVTWPVPCPPRAPVRAHKGRHVPQNGEHLGL